MFKIPSPQSERCISNPQKPASYTLLRNYDARLVSAIEAETRNDPVRLAEMIRNLDPKHLQLDTSTMRRLCFLYQ